MIQKAPTEAVCQASRSTQLMKMTKLTNKCIRVKTRFVFLVGGGRPEPRAAYTFRDDASGGVASFRYPVQDAGRVEHTCFVWAMIWAHFYSVQVHRTCTYHLYFDRCHIILYMPYSHITYKYLLDL